MNRYKYLLKNVGILTIGNLGSNIILFLLVPLYTSVLTTEEYGIYDLFCSINSMLIPILTINISEAVVRFSIDREYSRKSVFTIGLRQVLISVLIITAFLAVNHFAGIWEIVDSYWLEFSGLYLCQALAGVIIGFSRALEGFKTITASVLMGSVTLIVSGLFFLLVLRWGIRGFFLANILGYVVQLLFLIIHQRLMRYVSIRGINREDSRAMLSFSRPLIVNSISWWITSLSDRYFVTWLCGVGENGIYSVASKIPSILNLFQKVFNEAWLVSAVKDFDREDREGFFTNTYSMYNCIMTLICSFLVVVSRILSVFLYSGEFFVAWKYVSFLTIAALFGALAGYLGGLFVAMKDTRVYARSTFAGALLNILLNAILIPFIGVLGAAIATMLSYFLIWVYRLVCIKREMKIRPNLIRDLVSYGIMTLQAALFFVFQTETLMLYVLEIGLTALMLLLYRKEVSVLLTKLSGILRRKR